MISILNFYSHFRLSLSRARQRTIVLRSLWSDKCIQLSGNAATIDSKLWPLFSFPEWQE